MTTTAANPKQAPQPLRNPNDTNQALDMLPQGADVDERVLGTAFLVSPHAQFILDWSGRILVCNRRAERTYWSEDLCALEDLRGKGFHCLTKLSETDALRELREGTASGMVTIPMRATSHLQNAGGTVFRISLLRSANRGERLILLTQDQLKVVTDALSSMNQRRIKSYNELQRLERAHSALQSTLVSMEAFSRAASHDLKTPLNTMAVALELMGTNFADEYPDTVKQYVDVMQKAVLQMEELTTDFLQHVRTTSAVVAAEPIVLRNEIETVCRNLTVALSDCEGQVEIDAAQGEVLAEPVLFRVLLTNLLTNAIKYRSKDRALRVKIAVIAEKGAPMKLEVRDNGTGLDPSDIDDIFEPFKQLANASDGAGIGLSTCKEICRRHGWTITAHGELESYAAFEVNFGSPPKFTD